MSIPKSKDARRKVRRWEYTVTAWKDDREGTFQSPAMTIGPARTARETAVQMEKDLANLPQFEGAILKVTPKACETVSREILQQITGLSDENKVLVRAIKNLVTDLTGRRIHESEISSEDEKRGLDDLVKEAMGKAVVEARQQMIDEQQAKAQAVAQEMGGEAVLASELQALAEEPVPDQPIEADILPQEAEL